MQKEYILNFHESDIFEILENEDVCSHFSINVNFIVLYEHQPQLVVELLKEPEKSLKAWDQATIEAQMFKLKTTDTKWKLKNNVHCRIYHLPGVPEVCRTFFPGNEDDGKFLQVSGTVMSISPVKLLQYQRNYICIKCKYPTLVIAEYERKYIIKQPKKCGNPDICSGTNFLQIGELDSEQCKDFQQIKIQEQIKRLGVGSMPNTMWVTLEDDLVDICKPGDSVTICGIVKRRWGEFSKGSKIDIDIVLKANNVQVDSNSVSMSASTTELQEMFKTFWDKYSGHSLIGRDLILKSLCPQIYGLYLVKLAIAVILAGGCQLEDTTFTGVRTRSESHLLLVGDPGTGKSQLLRFVSKIIPRSILTTGVGSTAAGLTVAAIMEHGEWQLEGGALVMSDGGVCCIDEFNSMKEHDRTSIHEAMEQQTISVAKASIVCKLNTRCSILAACNPKGNLDPFSPLCVNIALPSPLLSRFDLILLLRDNVNEQWDTEVADYILREQNSHSKLTNKEIWTIDVMQSYFGTIKKINPKLSESAEVILSTYYQIQRRMDNRNKARTTVRLLESLIRLSQGHARLMFHNEVEVMDSIYAVVLVEATMDNSSSILNLNINTRSVFPEYPIKIYRNLLEKVLNKLQLYDILQKEIELIKENKDPENVMSRFFNVQYNFQGSESKEGKISSTNIIEANSHKQKSCTSIIDNYNKKRKNANDDSDKSHKRVKESVTTNIEREMNTKCSSTYNNVNIQTTSEKCLKEKDLNHTDILPESSSLKLDNKSVNNDLNSNDCKETKPTNKRSTRLDLKKFKFVPRNNDDTLVQKNKMDNEIVKNLPEFAINEKSSNDCIKDDVGKLMLDANDDCTRNNDVNTVSGKNDSVTNETNSSYLIKEDLEMLKLIPDANDDFEIDLDFDWDSVKNV